MHFLKKALLPCIIATLSLSGAAGAQGMEGMNFMSPSEFLKYLPPIISSVKHYPKVPEADNEVKVIARVGRISFGEDYEFIDTVTLFYSTDYGDTWEEIAMEQEDGKERVWFEYIPGFEDGTEVVYYVQVRDSVGNIAMMLSPDMAMDPEWFEILDSDEEIVDSPHDFLIHMYDHEDGVDEEVPSYFDLMATYFGYDDDFLYFRYEFETKPFEGTISPLDINVYAMLLINTSLIFSPKIMAAMQNFKPGDKPDTSILESERDSLVGFFSNMWFWYYAPLADIAPPIPDIGKLPGMALAHIDPDAAGCPIGSGASLDSMGPGAIKCIAFEPEGWEYEIHDTYLDVAIDREMIGPAVDDTINFTLFNLRAVGPDMMNIKPIPGDVAYSVSVIMSDRWYIVGEESGSDDGD